MTVCYECGKQVKGKITTITPPLYLLRLGDFVRAYHPGCYKRLLKQADKEIAEAEQKRK